MAFRILASDRVKRIIDALSPRFIGRDQDHLLALADEAADAGYSAAYDYTTPLYTWKTTIESTAGASDVGINDAANWFTSSNVEGALQELGSRPMGGVTSVFGRTGAVAAAANDYTFAQLASKPTSLAGYGIPVSDVLTQLKTVDGAGSGLDADLLDGQSGSYYIAWGNFTGTPTTLAGYGITDALNINGGTLGGGLSFGAVVGASSTDLSKHITLHTAGYGFGITANRLNYVVPTSGTHRFVINGVDIATVQSNGLVLTGNLVASGTVGGSNLSGTNTGDQNLAPYATLAAPALTGAGTINGNPIGFRNVPLTAHNAAYTLVAGDAGTGLVHNDTTARTYTINNSVFAAGDVVTVLNDNATAAVTLTPGSGVTMYLAGSATTGSRTVAVRGLATIFFASAAICYVSGPGVT